MSAPRRVAVLTFTVALVAVVVGCAQAPATGPASSTEPTAPSSSAPSSSAPSSSAPSAGAPASSAPVFDCDAEPVDPVSAEHAASCVYEAWVTEREVPTSPYGVDGVLDGLPVVMDDPRMLWRGCSDQGGAALDGVVCSWEVESLDGPVVLEMGLAGSVAEGFRVAEVELIR
ncbi:hypothetical protein [Cellulomonas sp. NS3]|uniref:hypothetical protein n=1 Tax=Cellulomonas sp. NS3 TaxID=2973977 RepID=UPI002162C001|nr:hypothetical protein [Cellulomonas sp. NS3]